MEWSISIIPTAERERDRKAKRENRVDVYGIIFHDVRHPFVRKVLTDEVYWQALDALSGERWTIYACKPHDMHKARRGRDEVLAAMKHYRIERYADHLPVIAVLLDDHRGEPRSCVERIVGKSVDETYNSILDTLQTATRAIERIDSPNLRNSEDVFTQIELEVDNEKEKRMLMSLLRKAPFLKELWGFVKR